MNIREILPQNLPKTKTTEKLSQNTTFNYKNHCILMYSKIKPRKTENNANFGPKTQKCFEIYYNIEIFLGTNSLLS